MVVLQSYLTPQLFKSPGRWSRAEMAVHMHQECRPLLSCCYSTFFCVKIHTPFSIYIHLLCDNTRWLFQLPPSRLHFCSWEEGNNTRVRWVTLLLNVCPRIFPHFCPVPLPNTWTHSTTSCKDA